MFSHRILFYKSSFQWDWVHSSCSELTAQETEATQTWQGQLSVIFCFPVWYFQTFYFFKSKVGVFLVRTAQLKKKKKKTFFPIVLKWDKTIKFFIQTHPQCTFLLFTMGVNEMRTYHYSQESYRKKKIYIYIWQYDLDYI